MHNRLFNRQEPVIRGSRASFVDVTSIALDCRFPFTTHVSRSLLATYTISGVADDHDGRIFVECILNTIEKAMAGTIWSINVSFGRSLEMHFKFVAQHRRWLTPETVKLCALLGPWDAPEVFVWLCPRRTGSNDPLAQQPVF